jgi:hypothetical protein
LNSQTKPDAKSGHFHAVRFYETRESLCRIVAEFLGEGFVLGNPALVIATPEHEQTALSTSSAPAISIPTR